MERTLPLNDVNLLTSLLGKVTQIHLIDAYLIWEFQERGVNLIESLVRKLKSAVNLVKKFKKVKRM